MGRNASVSRAFHEDLSRGEIAAGGSERAFGIVFAAVFAVVGLWPLAGGGAVRAWALAVAGALVAVALARPRWLAGPNRLWARLGHLLHKVVTPVVMGLVFFATVTPVALIMRALGKDPLALRFDRGAQSYWIERRPPGPAPATMRNQF